MAPAQSQAQESPYGRAGSASAAPFHCDPRSVVLEGLHSQARAARLPILGKIRGRREHARGELTLVKVMNKASDSITLRLEGARAKRGVTLSDFESFIENFLAALRDFDRDQRGVPTKKSGAPEARAAAMTSFRLIGFREGSGIATIEPELAPLDGDTEPMVDAEPIQLTNLRSLLSSVEEERELPESVTDALEKARRTAGDDGTLAVDVPCPTNSQEPSRHVVIDAPRLERIRAARKTPPLSTVSSISGRLHQVDFEPDKLAIRASDGVDWVCSFPQELEHQVETLVNRLVWASGSGVLQSPRRGAMKLAEIKAVEQGIQTGLFSGEPIPDDQLAAAQGISGPQGLDAVAAVEWTDADDAYLAALTGD